MKFVHDHTFRDYVNSGNETTKELLESGSPMVAALEEYYAFFADGLWQGDDVQMSPNQAFLSMNAFLIYTSAVRVALSGHAAAIFPLLRTALESACYAYLLSQDKAFEEAWAERHSSREAGKRCRKKFGTALEETARRIEAGDESRKGHAAWIRACYQSVIDHGAHPNPRSIYRHIQPPKDIGDHMLVNLAALYGANDEEIIRAMMACLDYGLVIAFVLAFGLKSPNPDLSGKLQHLNDLKERLADDLFENQGGYFF